MGRKKWGTKKRGSQRSKSRKDTFFKWGGVYGCRTEEGSEKKKN